MKPFNWANLPLNKPRYQRAHCHTDGKMTHRQSQQKNPVIVKLITALPIAQTGHIAPVIKQAKNTIAMITMKITSVHMSSLPEHPVCAFPAGGGSACRLPRPAVESAIASITSPS